MTARRHAARGTAALVDVDHGFDPPTAVRAGVDLGRMLWIRCGRRRDLALRATDLLVRCPGSRWSRWTAARSRRGCH